MSEPGEGFSSRWSRRKGEARVAGEPVREADRDAAEVAALTPADGDVAAPAPAQQDPPSDSPPPDLPSIDSLTSESDFSQFMQEGVPEELRRLALRKLWRLTPIIPDGLDDYDEDYSMIGIVAQKVSTLFKPGEGMRDPEEEETASADSTDAPDADAATEETKTEETEPGETESGETESGETESEQDKAAEKDVDDESGDGADDADTIDDEVDDADGEIA